MSKNNLTLGYVLLVGVPLLVLLTTLHAGADLTAPPALSGEWMIESTAGNCAGPLAGAGQAPMSIYQTGPELLITFNDPGKTTLAGTVENGRIAAVSNTARCGAAFRLEAAMAGKPGQRFLLGQLLPDGCSKCAPVPFRANKVGTPGR